MSKRNRGDGSRRAYVPSIAAAVALTSVATLSVASTQASGAPMVAPADTSVDQQVKSTSAQLSDAAHAVLAAEDSLEDISNQLPAAKQQVVQAQQKLATAQQVAVQAAQAVVAAQAAAADAKAQVAKTQQDIAGLRGRIGALAAQVYISGGEYQELEILLNSQSPEDMLVQMASVRRTARANSTVLAQLATLQAELKEKVKQLKSAQAVATDKQQEADDRQADAQAAQQAAVAAQQNVEAMIAKRKTDLADAQANRKTIKATYQKLLAEQRRLIAEAAAKAAAAAAAAANGGTPVSIPPGGSPQAIAAVKFALSQVGHRYVSSGGTGPNYGCNGFAWRSWHEAGSKWPLMMAQDQAMSRRWVVPVEAGQEMPGDLIFWRFNNGTDSRPNAIDHVGIIVDPGSGLFVAAANTARGVVTDNYKEGHYSHPAMFGRVIA